MNTLINFSLNVLIFQGVACLLLGVVFFARRYFKQPIDRIRLTQFGFALVAAAMLWFVFGPKYSVPISHNNHVDTTSVGELGIGELGIGDGVELETQFPIPKSPIPNSEHRFCSIFIR